MNSQFTGINSAVSSGIPRAKTLDLLWALLLLGSLYLFGCALDGWYQRYGISRVDGAQTHYSALPLEDQPRVLFWVELGKDRAISHRQSARIKAEIHGRNFYPGDPWAREVHWSARAKVQGQIDVLFDKEAAARLGRLGLFFSDGDSFQRVAVLESGGQKRIVENLHDGRWIFLPFNEQELAAGKKTVVLRQLMGEDIALSAVLLLEKAAPQHSEGQK